MLKKASILWLAAIGLLGLVTILESLVPRDIYGDMIPEVILLHSVLEHVFKFLTGVLVFSLVDKILLPHLNIDDVIMGKGRWSNVGEDQVRAAAIRMWGLLFAVVLYSFMVVI